MTELWKLSKEEAHAEIDRRLREAMKPKRESSGVLNKLREVAQKRKTPAGGRLPVVPS